MRTKWLALVIFGLRLIAAEKNRDWQPGQIVEIGVETTVRADSQVHTIASASKNYVVRGSFGNAEQELKVGDSVRFAVEGKTMYLSLAGKEIRLFVLGERIAAQRDPEAARPAAAAPKPPPPPVPAPPPPVAPAKAAVTSEPLDNDAIVKMILGGLKEDTVVQVIQTRPGKYSLGSDAVGALKAAGVPQAVIAAMTAKMNAPR